MEYLVTAQAYDKTDPYKQTFLLHDTFITEDAIDAENAFNAKFEPTHKITRIFSVIDVSCNV
jgi:hypothetical protein